MSRALKEYTRERASAEWAINNNMLGDMPVGEPFDVHLQRSSQLAVGLLERQRCQGKAPHSFATIEVRRAPPSRMRLQLEFQRC